MKEREEWYVLLFLFVKIVWKWAVERVMWLHVTDFEYRIKNQIQKKEFQMEILKNHRVRELKMKVKG